MRCVRALPVLLVFVLLGAVAIAPAQGPEQPYPPPEQQPQAQPGSQQVWSSEQLDNLVAPVALYPDPLLGQILVASTYPIEVVEANQWLQRNRNLRGQALMDAAKQQPWDPSVQALVAIPDALAKLNQDLRWTADLGNAFLSQQSDVMSAAQRMRARAQDNGRLSSTPQQTVTTQNQGGQQAIVIQPADPQVIYVPTYDPYWVWGPPIYGYYPPLFYPAFGFGFGPGFDLAFCFGGWGGWGFWGWGPSWFGHSVFVNTFFFNQHGFHHHDHFAGGLHGFQGRTPWVHDPSHRMRVPYSTTQVAARFGGRSVLPGNSFRGAAGSGSAAPLPQQAQRSQSPTPRYQYLGQSSPRSSQIEQPQRSMAQVPQQSRGTPRVVPFGSQSQLRNQVIAPSRPEPQVSRSFATQRFQGQPQQRIQALPQSQQRIQSLPQPRIAPQMSAPRFNGGSFGGSSFFGRSGGMVSRGGGGSFSRGGGGNFSRGGGGFSRGGGGGRR